jgi:hypothetical protein
MHRSIYLLRVAESQQASWRQSVRQPWAKRNHFMRSVAHFLSSQIDADCSRVPATPDQHSRQRPVLVLFLRRLAFISFLTRMNDGSKIRKSLPARLGRIVRAFEDATRIDANLAINFSCLRFRDTLAPQFQARFVTVRDPHLPSALGTRCGAA